MGDQADTPGAASDTALLATAMRIEAATRALGTAIAAQTDQFAAQGDQVDERERAALIASVSQSQNDAVARDVVASDAFMYQLIALAITIAGVALTAGVAVEQLRLSFAQSYAPLHLQEPAHLVTLGRSGLVALVIIGVGALATVVAAYFVLSRGRPVLLGPRQGQLAGAIAGVSAADAYFVVASAWADAFEKNSQALSSRHRNAGLCLLLLLVTIAAAVAEFIVTGVLSPA